MANSLGIANPLTYRGYVYDAESSLYYLQSRYYNPEVGRFINADAFASTGQGFIGNNMFAYCLNNPIACSDASGSAAKICLTADGRMNVQPWRDASPGGGGLLPGKYSTHSSYGSVADKFYTARLMKFIFNTDERAVLEADTFAFYKGVPYFKVDLGHGGAFSFGMVFLDDYYEYDELGIKVVNHEYGHIIHFHQIGVRSYLFNVAIPSLIWAGLSNAEIIDRKYYYSMPTEYIADWLGGASHTNVIKNEDVLGILYWIYTLIVP